MKISVLDAKTLGDDLSLAPLAELGELAVYGTSSKEELFERIKDTEIAVLNKVKITEELLAAAPCLKLVTVCATGYDNIDIDACRRRGVGVCNVAGYSTDSVAQVTLSCALSLYTHLSEYRKKVASGEYTKGGVQNILTPVYHEIAGKTWGIFGYGNIGKKVADIARAMGARVIYCKNTPDENSVSLNTLLKESDIISLHSPLTDKTRGIINAEAIEKMKDGAILINAARGAVTEEGAVRDAVVSGKIGGYACDVYSVEPLSEDNPIYELKDRENVILTPHMAWGSYEARVRVIAETAKNIESFTSGGRRSRVD